MKETINNTTMDKNTMVKKYMPLVYKIAGQLHKGMGYDMDDCVSAGMEGILYALDTYKDDKKQTFTQYAAYMIRFSIMNDFNRNGRTIRVSWDQQKKAAARGEDINICQSIDRAARDDEDGTTVWERKLEGQNESDILLTLAPDEEELWDGIWKDIREMFNERDRKIFFLTFGVGGMREMTGKDLAAEMGISPAAITQSRNKIIRKIRKNKELMDKLVEVMCVMNRENY